MSNAELLSESGSDQKAEDQQRLSQLLSRIQQLTTAPSGKASEQEVEVADQSQANGQSKGQVTSSPSAQTLGAVAGDQSESDKNWWPHEPNTLAEAGLSESEVENLILKLLNARAEATGRIISEHVKLSFRLIDPLLQQMKQDQLVAHKGAAMMNDYIYQLTGVGRERGKKLAEHCTYYGASPVPIDDYIASVAKQTIADQHPTETDLANAFSDLLIDKKMLLRLGPAVNSGRGLFLYGAPGNGKTSIAERVTGAFGEHVWIPRALGVDGEIMRLFDPSLHEEVPIEAGPGLIDTGKIDSRWVRIKRPTIVVGGELTMSSLEVTLNTATNVSEAPIQLKSNCGTLVIDDFGRQRMTTDELLNRWIVPLEKRYDYLNLASGKKIQVPFDQLIIFSTNLEPKDLVDDAFLRRIPYKIEVVDPDETAFRKLFEIMSPIIGVEYNADAVEYLIQRHYKAENRPMRCCQPRDLLSQIRNYCHYVDKPATMTTESFDFAVENYFAVM